MTFHRCMILANPAGGTMAATNSRYMKRTSRQWLRRNIQLVAPGGKMLGFVEQSFQQQRYQQFPMQPGATTVRSLLGQLAQAEDRFHAFESQFDLPPTAVPMQHSGGVEHIRSHVCPDVEIACQKERGPRQALLLL